MVLRVHRNIHWLLIPLQVMLGLKVLAAPIVKKPGDLMNMMWMRRLIIERFLKKNTSFMIKLHLEMFSRKHFDTNMFSWAAVCFLRSGRRCNIHVHCVTVCLRRSRTLCDAVSKFHARPRAKWISRAPQMRSAHSCSGFIILDVTDLNKVTVQALVA